MKEKETKQIKGHWYLDVLWSQGLNKTRLVKPKTKYTELDEKWKNTLTFNSYNELHTTPFHKQ